MFAACDCRPYVNLSAQKKPPVVDRGLNMIAIVRRHDTGVEHYALNDLPQPQPFEAFGLSKRKPRPLTSSQKSSTAPSR